MGSAPTSGVNCPPLYLVLRATHSALANSSAMRASIFFTSGCCERSPVRKVDWEMRPLDTWPSVTRDRRSSANDAAGSQEQQRTKEVARRVSRRREQHTFTAAAAAKGGGAGKKEQEEKPPKQAPAAAAQPGTQQQFVQQKAPPRQRRTGGAEVADGVALLRRQEAVDDAQERVHAEQLQAHRRPASAPSGHKEGEAAGGGGRGSISFPSPCSQQKQQRRHHRRLFSECVSVVAIDSHLDTSSETESPSIIAPPEMEASSEAGWRPSAKALRRWWCWALRLRRGGEGVAACGHLFVPALGLLGPNSA